MAGKRFKIVDASGYSAVPTARFQTDAAAGDIDAGMIVILTANGSPYVTPLVTNDQVIGTNTAIIGLAAGSSTHTALVDGYVDVYMPLPGIVYEGYADTASNIDTQAKLDAYMNDRVQALVSATTIAGDWTIDEDGGEDQTSPFMLVDGDFERGTVKFIIREGATYLGDQDLS